MKDKVIIVLLACNLVLSGLAVNHGHHQHAEQEAKQTQNTELSKKSHEGSAKQSNDSVVNSIAQMLYSHEQNCSIRESMILREIIRIQDKLGVEIDPQFEGMIPEKEGTITEVGKKETLQGS